MSFEHGWLQVSKENSKEMSNAVSQRVVACRMKCGVTTSLLKKNCRTGLVSKVTATQTSSESDMLNSDGDAHSCREN